MRFEKKPFSSKAYAHSTFVRSNPSHIDAKILLASKLLNGLHSMRIMVCGALLGVAFCFNTLCCAQTISVSDEAQVQLQRQHYDLQELRHEKIYLDTYEQCRPRRIGETPAPRRPYTSSFSRASASQFFLVAGLLNIEEAAKIVRQKGLSSILKEAFDSEAFHLALRDCYKTDFYGQTKFISEIIQADAGGRVIGSVAALATWASVAGVFKVIGLGGAALIKTFKYVGTGLGVVGSVPIFMELYQNQQIEKTEGPTEAFSQLRSIFQTQQMLPGYMIQLIDKKLQQVEEQLESAATQAEITSLLELREQLRLARIDQLMAQQEIEKRNHLEKQNTLERSKS